MKDCYNRENIAKAVIIILLSGVPGVDGHPGNDNGSAGCRPAADRAIVI
jgi:hypothetical protein